MFGSFLPLTALTGLEGFLIGTSFLALDYVPALFFAGPVCDAAAAADFVESALFAAFADVFFWPEDFFRFNRPIGLLKT